MARSMERNLSPTRGMERDLVLAFQSGDPVAFDSIDKSCRPAAERICRRLLINPADVEEAVQETMVRAYQGLPRFNGSYALTAWVARIATNVCLDTLRARSRRPQSAGTIEPHMEVPNGHESNGHLDPEELVEQAAEAEAVREVLQALPERHRTALVLREFEGYSHRQIAEMLDTSPARVKALIHRAKAGFRRAWDGEHPGRLAAFAPLLTPINWVRRLFGRAPEFDVQASALASATTVATAATPTVYTYATFAAERLSTALATVMIAGTVSFAVQHAPTVSRAEEQPAVVEMVTAPVEEAEAKPVVEAEEKEKRERVKPVVTPSPIPEVAPSPEAVEEVVLEEPKDTEVPEPAPSPSPALPPHPTGFAYMFGSDRTSTDPCGCGGAPSVTQEGVDVSESSLSSYEGRLAGAITDANGQAAWAVEGRLDAASGSIDFPFTISTQYGSSSYGASATLTDRVRQPWGGWTYTYEGAYAWHGGPREHAELPQRGSFSVSLTVSWVEQRLVSAELELREDVD